MMLLRLLLLVAATATTFTYAEYTEQALKDQIANLPGSEDLDIDFNQFSGYLKVGGTKNMVSYSFLFSKLNPYIHILDEYCTLSINFIRMIKHEFSFFS